MPLILVLQGRVCNTTACGAAQPCHTCVRLQRGAEWAGLCHVKCTSTTGCCVTLSGVAATVLKQVRGPPLSYLLPPFSSFRKPSNTTVHHLSVNLLCYQWLSNFMMYPSPRLLISVNYVHHKSDIYPSSYMTAHWSMRGLLTIAKFIAWVIYVAFYFSLISFYLIF